MPLTEKQILVLYLIGLKLDSSLSPNKDFFDEVYEDGMKYIIPF